MWYWYIIYIVLAILIVYLSIKLANYVDALDKKTTISGAFIGGVMLAAVTSLPELFTTISAILIVKEPELVIGNIIGSDLFNLVVIGLSVSLFIIKWHRAKIGVIHVKELLITLVITLLVIYSLVSPYQPQVGPINLLVVPILALYILSIKIQPKEDDSTVEEGEEVPEGILALPVKTIVIRFIISAVLLIAVSIGLTYATDKVADALNLGATVAGSIFLAIATSLPELISTITLCKKGNFDAGFGNIVGSNNFNYFILFFAEMISWNKDKGYNGSVLVYHSNEAFLLALFLVLSILLSISLILVHKYETPKLLENKGNKTVFNIISITIGILIVLSYILYEVLNPFILIF